MTSEIVEAFQRLCREHPQQPLIHLPADGTSLTIAEIADAAREVVRALDAAVAPRALVAAAIGNRPGALAVFLACRLSQRPYLPLDLGTTPAETETIARRFGVATVIHAAKQTFRGFQQPAPFPLALWTSVAQQDPGDSRFADLCVLKMTSGSTGVPRAAATRESALVHDSRILMEAMSIAPDAVQVAAIPLSHAYGFGNLLVPALLQGSPLVMRDAFIPQRLIEDAHAYGARVFPGVPYMFDHFASNTRAGSWPPTLRRLISAGAPLTRPVADAFLARFGVKVHSFYGTSETGGIAYDDSDEPVDDGIVGRPLPGVEVTLVPQDGTPPGAGRLLVAGPAVIDGYADGDDAECFVNGGFLTGDLGVFDRAGCLGLMGRVSAFVNVAGRKVHPDEVERVLRQFAGVEDVRVVGVADVRRGEQLVAALVVRGTRPSLLALRRFCGAHLAPHKIPRAFVFLDGIPSNARGKTDRQRLDALLSHALQQQDRVL